MTEMEQIDSGNTKFRVKIYEGTDSGNWVDKGTGHVFTTFSQGAGYSIIVKSEKDGSCVLTSTIDSTEYQQQQETLILWRDSSNVDLALSFQEPAGCQEIWNQVEEIQKRLAVDSHDIDQMPSNVVAQNGEQDHALDPDFTLPVASISNLAQIESIFSTAVRSMAYRETLLKRVMETDFLEKFIELLEQCEDMEMIEDCFRLSTIVKCLFFLNNADLFILLLQDPYFIIILGMLEYDKEYPTTKAYYREYFTSQVHFKQVLPIKDVDLVDEIQRVYRASYIKDVALARTLEDSTYGALNTLIYQTQADIIGKFQQDQEYIAQIIDIASGQNKALMEKQPEAISFLQELLSMVKNFTREIQNPFYKVLGKHGLYSVVQNDLQVLYNVLEHSPAPIRSQVLADKAKSKDLLTLLIERVEQDSLDDQLEIIEIIRLFLDTSGSGVATTDSLELVDLDKFLELFYDEFCSRLFSALDRGVVEKASNEVEFVDGVEYDLVIKLMDLLSFLIVQNGMFCKNHLIQSTLMKKVALFLQAPKAFVRLAALGVFRTCLNLNDEFYRRLLMKQQVFGRVLTCLLETNGKNNLLNSACLEFFDLILKSDGMKSVITHIVTMYQEKFTQLDYVDIFEMMVKKFDSFSEKPIVTSASKDGYEKVDATEEAYFLKDDDPAVNVSDGNVVVDNVVNAKEEELEFVRGGVLKPLVPYDLDDDGEDFFTAKKNVSKKISINLNLNSKSVSSSSSSEAKVSQNESNQPAAKRQRLNL